MKQKLLILLSNKLRQLLKLLKKTQFKKRMETHYI